MGSRQALRRSRDTLGLWGLLRASACTSKCHRCTNRKVDPVEEDLCTFEWLPMSYQFKACVNESRVVITQRIRAYAPLGSDELVFNAPLEGPLAQSLKLWLSICFQTRLNISLITVALLGCRQMQSPWTQRAPGSALLWYI